MSRPKLPTFEERYPEIVRQIQKRRRKWTLGSVDFEDVQQILLIHIHRKYGLYDPVKDPTFVHWVNTVISNRINGILRDNHLIYSRPCVTGCIFNTGGDTCSKTSSGLQCIECPLYRNWHDRKADHFNVKQTLPIETHEQEVNNQQSDFVDIEGKKKIIDREMKERLDPGEFKIYRMLMIQGKSEKECGAALGGKKRAGRMFQGYQQLLKLRHKFVKLAKEIIEQEGLA